MPTYVLLIMKLLWRELFLYETRICLSVTGKWNVLRDEFVFSGNGKDCRLQPDWHKDSDYILNPLITSRNALFAK